MPKKTGHGWGLFWLSCGVGAVVGLIATSSLPDWNVYALALFAGFSFFRGATLLGWFNAPVAIGKPIRILLFALLVVPSLGWLVKHALFAIEASPPSLTFNGDIDGERFTVNLRNRSDGDLFDAQFILRTANGMSFDDVWLDLDQFRPASKGSLYQDVNGLYCTDRQGIFLSISALRLAPHDGRGLIITARNKAKGTITIEADGYEREPLAQGENAMRQKYTHRGVDPATCKIALRFFEKNGPEGQGPSLGGN